LTVVRAVSEDEKKAESPSKIIMITTRMAILSPDGAKKINSYYFIFYGPKSPERMGRGL
jgi:hypothetical protein